MSNSEKQVKNNKFAFTSLDGKDENGHRAEVRVKLNRGKVRSITPSAKGAVVKIDFAVDGARFPVAGWAPAGSEAHVEAERAQKADEEVDIRLESQRKPETTDRTTPINDLTTADNNRDLVKSLVVSVNGKPSGEGVTNPAEDHLFNGTGRYVAGDEDRASAPATAGTSAGTAVSAESALGALRNAVTSQIVRPTIVDALAAQALLAGASPDEVNIAIAGQQDDDRSRQNTTPPAGVATESRPWSLYNTDGRLNLGSALISAGAGIENLVHKNLADAGGLGLSNTTEVSVYLQTLVFSICDAIQAGAYGTGARPDRMANSHARVRGIVYETVNRHLPFPVKVEGDRLVASPEELSAWASNVGRESKERFMQAIQASQNIVPFRAVQAPASLTGVEAPAAPQTASAPAQAPAAPEAVPAPAQSVPAPKTPSAPAPVAEDAEAEARRAAARSIVANPPAVDLSAPVAEEESAETGSAVFAPRHNTEGEHANEEAVEMFKEMLAENGMDLKSPSDLGQISALLNWTFGVGKASEVPEADLIDFIDHYSATGAAGLREAIQAAYESQN